MGFLTCTHKSRFPKRFFVFSLTASDSGKLMECRLISEQSLRPNFRISGICKFPDVLAKHLDDQFHYERLEVRGWRSEIFQLLTSNLQLPIVVWLNIRAYGGCLGLKRR